MDARPAIWDELICLREQRPFHSFVIVTARGARYRVTRPLQFAMSDTRIVIVDQPGGLADFRIDDIVAICGQKLGWRASRNYKDD